MIDERKDPELEQVAACFETLTGRVEELVDAGMKASRKVYYQGKLEVYERLLANLSNFDQGIDSFFMGSLWNDIKSKEELIGQLRSDNENGVDVPVDRDEEMEAKYSLHFLKKRARANSGDSEDVKRLESLPGASLKPLKKTQ